MCGIIGGITSDSIEKVLLDGLKYLEYRGYDSSGLALSENGKITVRKKTGKISVLKDELKKNPLKLAHIGIAHNRWATHGAPSEINAHPQLSFSNNIAIVHNGVIDNFAAMKSSLVAKGYEFRSETDTEVIADFLEEEKKQLGSLLLAIKRFFYIAKGSFALAILDQQEPDKIFFAKWRTPLLLGRGKGMNLLASDKIAFAPRIEEFYDVADGEYGYLQGDCISLFVYDKEIIKTPTFLPIDIKRSDIALGKYANYMEKEIDEGAFVIDKILREYTKDGKYKFDPELVSSLKNSEEVILIGSGSSYHAALLGCEYLLNAKLNAYAYIASEWAHYPRIRTKNPVFILLSQSGETADVLRSLDVIKNHRWPVISLVNIESSSLARRSNYVLPLFAGFEVAIVSTKTYICQVALLWLLANATMSNTAVIEELKKVGRAQRKVLSFKDAISNLAGKLVTQHDIYFIGRGLDYLLAREASLKFKEITYIHSEAFPAGELKHGPIALIEKGTPVIGFCSDETSYAHLMSNLEEAKARGGLIFFIGIRSGEVDEEKFTFASIDPQVNILIEIIYAQLLSYYATLRLGYDVDKPRNLAKSVTVE